MSKLRIPLPKTIFLSQHVLIILSAYSFSDTRFFNLFGSSSYETAFCWARYIQPAKSSLKLELFPSRIERSKAASFASSSISPNFVQTRFLNYILKFSIYLQSNPKWRDELNCLVQHWLTFVKSWKLGLLIHFLLSSFFSDPWLWIYSNCVKPQKSL